MGSARIASKGKTRPRTTYGLIRAAVTLWLDRKASRLAAAIAFYAMLSLAPLALLGVAVLGVFTSPARAEQELVAQAQEMLGEEVAYVVGVLLENAQQPTAGTVASLVGLGVMIFGATGVVMSLKWALDTMWGAEKAERGKAPFLVHRVFAFAVVIGACLLLLGLVTATTVISAFAERLRDVLVHPEAILQAANFLLSMGFVTMLVALVFRVLPEARLPRGALWTGAALTAVLFTVGQMLIGLYLTRAGATSVYGAAGSLVALLVWAYYSAQIVLLGAAFAKVFADRPANPP
jgi:membrane protein